jgi:hypothetical protein
VTPAQGDGHSFFAVAGEKVSVKPAGLPPGHAELGGHDQTLSISAANQASM